MGCNKDRGETRIEEILRLKGKNKKGRMRESSVVFYHIKTKIMYWVLNMGCNKNRGETRIEEIWRLKGKNKKGRMRESSVVFVSYKN
jgi:hypothetical protein